MYIVQVGKCLKVRYVCMIRLYRSEGLDDRSTEVSTRTSLYSRKVCIEDRHNVCSCRTSLSGGQVYLKGTSVWRTDLSVEGQVYLWDRSVTWTSKSKIQVFLKDVHVRIKFC